MTYELMAGYRSTPAAIRDTSVVADGINRADKIVFSRTLKKAEWNNTKLMKGNILDKIAAMMRGPGNNMAIPGSGSIVSRCAGNNLIDEYQVMIDPVAPPGGMPLFNGIRQKPDLELKGTGAYRSGAVLLAYRPMI